MKAETVANSGQGVGSLVLALVAAVFIFAVITDRNVPLVSSARGALIALFALGFVMCVVGGIGPKVPLATFSWTSPFVILGILLGVSAVYVAFAGLTGRTLPLVTGERGTFIWLAIIIVTKWVLSRIHTLQLG